MASRHAAHPQSYSAHQLPNSDYETVTSPEPEDSVVEMWTEVQKCTITINASLWRSWHQDDESFQWFCDAMTHEVGHLFGHLDSGQTNPSSITYPFLDSTSPNFNSVPECQCSHTAVRRRKFVTKKHSAVTERSSKPAVDSSTR